LLNKNEKNCKKRKITAFWLKHGKTRHYGKITAFDKNHGFVISVFP